MLGVMEENILEVILMTRKVVQVSSHGQMDALSMDNGKMETNMVLDSTLGAQVSILTVNGIKDK